MRNGDQRVGRFVPLFQRIIIGAAIVAAVPVVLWTITTYVRSYVGPPRLPTFQQLARLGDAVRGTDSSAQPPSAPSSQATPSDTAQATGDAGAIAGEARDLLPASAANSDRPAGTDAPSAAMADASLPPPTIRPGDAMPVQSRFDQAAANIWNQAAPANAATATADQATGALPDAAPLNGKIPLPRRRPSDLVMAKITVANVPMPRPRPGIAGPSPEAAAAPTQADAPAAAPLGFLQNVFH